MVKGRNPDHTIQWDKKGRPLVPDHPIIPFIRGDGIGPDIWAAAQPVFDTALKTVYKGKRSVIWHELFVGQKAREINGETNLLPDKVLEDISYFGIAIKGPLTTPVGGGFRSLNVTLRQKLDLYACIRPVTYLAGVPAPVHHPEKMRIVIFRENTEDVYAGIEWPAESKNAKEIISAINRMLPASGGAHLSNKSAIGIKPMSKYRTCRLVRRAIEYALENDYSSVTLVHKGNVMKYTEGAFRDWGYGLANEEFSRSTVREADVNTKYNGEIPPGKIVIKDRIADAMFQQILLRPEEYGVIATPNLNGDYLSDAAAAQVGGLGMAPGANMGDKCALFEATHGTAPKYAGLDKVNPTSLILSGAEMYSYMGWTEAADIILSAVKQTIVSGAVTYDLARQMKGAQTVKCSEFGGKIADTILQISTKNG